MGVSESGQPQGLRWGVLGAGRISRDFVDEARANGAITVTAVAARDVDRAKDLAGPDRAAFGDYKDMIASDLVDAVYVGLLHPSHLEMIEAAAEAGKHILCEKPLTMSADQTRQAVAASRASGTVLVEAYQYKHQPQTAHLGKLLQAGAIGRVLHLEVSCSFWTEFVPADRLFDPALGGGAILDVGCYPVSYAQLVAQWVAGQPVQPTTMVGGGSRAQTGPDVWAAATLTYASGLSAHLRCGDRLADGGVLRIYGEAGHIMLSEPWAPGRSGDQPYFEVSRVGEADSQRVPVEQIGYFTAEVQAVEALAARGAVAEADNQQSIGIAEVLDQWAAQL